MVLIEAIWAKINFVNYCAFAVLYFYLIILQKQRNKILYRRRIFYIDLYRCMCVSEHCFVLALEAFALKVMIHFILENK